MGFHTGRISAILLIGNGGNTMEAFDCGPYTVSLFFEEEHQSVVYAMLDGEGAEEVWARLRQPKPTLAAVSGMDWNRDLSPWRAPRIFRGGDDFGGGGPAFLPALTRQIVPSVEERLGVVPRSRAIAGYSLAGLFALWSVFNTEAFDRVASVSGSLWFDGFLEYMAANTPCGGLRHAYLSLGDREKSTRNPRMAAVEDRTRQAAALLGRRGVPVTLELNPGGHFQEVSGRIAQGIDRVLAYK